MPNPIDLKIVDQINNRIEPIKPDSLARTLIEADQLQSLISLIESSNLINLPRTITWNAVKGFNISVLPNGKGVLSARY